MENFPHPSCLTRVISSEYSFCLAEKEAAKNCQHSVTFGLEGFICSHPLHLRFSYHNIRTGETHVE